MLDIIVDYSLKLRYKVTLTVIGCGAGLSSLLFLLLNVPDRPGTPRGGPAGGLPRAKDGTERLSVVRPARPKGWSAIFGQEGWPHRVRHVSAGQGGWTAGDGRG